FVIARHLDNAEVDVRVLLFADPATLTGDAAVMYRILAHSGPPLSVHGDPLDEARLRAELAGADWVVDALFGSGLQGPVRPPFAGAIGARNASGARVRAVDIPWGLDADTGAPVGPTVRADHTATIAAPKKSFSADAARLYLGRVHVIDMGMPRRMWP